MPDTRAVPAGADTVDPIRLHRLTTADPARSARVPRLLHAADLGSLGRARFLRGIERHTIPERSVLALYGPPASAKTFLALDWSLRLAQAAPVIYVAAEGQAGIHARVAAWQHHHQRDVGHLHVWPHPIDLGNHDALDDLGRAWAALHPALIVVDTLVHCMPTLDENRAVEMTRAVDGAGLLRDHTGAAVLLIHHANKSGLVERGSTALRAAVDVVLAADADDGQITLTCVKLKDGAAPWPPRSYRLLTVPLPQLADPDDPPDDPPTSCVLLPAPARPLVPRSAAELTHLQAALLDTLGLAAYAAGAGVLDLAEQTGRSRTAVSRAVSGLIAASWLEASRTPGKWTIAPGGAIALDAWRSLVEARPAVASPGPSEATDPVPPPAPTTPTAPAAPLSGHLRFLKDYIAQERIPAAVARAACRQLTGHEDAAALAEDEVWRLVSRLQEGVMA